MANSFKLKSNFAPAGQQPEAIANLIKGLAQKFQHQVLLGVTGCGKTFAVANVIAKTACPTLIIAHNKTLAAQLYGEMREFFPENAVEYFVSYYDYYQPEAFVPATNTYIEKDAAINEQIEQLRLSATKALLERRDTIIVATVSAIYGLGDPEAYLKLILRLNLGEKFKQRELMLKLVELQYKRNDIDFARGNFRVRGETIDIFPAEEEKNGIRIELFDDTVSNIFYFDALTNQTLKKLTHVTIFPATHYVTDKSNMRGIVDAISAELEMRLKELRENNKLVEAQRLEERTRYDMEMLLEIGYCQGIENYSRYLSGRSPGTPPPTLIDYLPKGSLLIIDESHVTIPQLHAMYRGDRSRKETLVQYGFRLPSALDNRPLRFDEFETLAPPTIYVSATPGPYELQKAEQVVELLVRPTGLIDPEVIVKPAQKQVADLLIEIAKRVKQKERVLVTTLTKRMAEDLCKYLEENGVKVRYLHSDVETVERVEILRDLRLGVFDVLIGINLLREGLDLPEVALVAILDADKEGFLRSRQALIQVSGRAARNLNGKVIMYADKITTSMRDAMDEMDRRRITQLAFNKQHGITPKGIIKSVQNILPSNTPEETESSIKGKISDKQLEEVAAIISLPPEKVARHIKKLEKAMQQHARKLEFEKAAEVRNQVLLLKEALLK